MKPKKTEITEKLRREINNVVNRYIDSGIAELVPGVLFIDEVHMLDQECFTFLNKALESQLAPIVIFATNRGVCPVKGSDGMVAPHGIPVDLLDRLLIVRTIPYTSEENVRILAVRADVEEIELDEASLARLGEVGDETTLRHAAQLMTPAAVIAQQSGREEISIADLEECQRLFLIRRRALSYCKSKRINLSRIDNSIKLLRVRHQCSSPNIYYVCSGETNKKCTK